jgi:hypothetical protein
MHDRANMNEKKIQRKKEAIIEEEMKNNTFQPNAHKYEGLT